MVDGVLAEYALLNETGAIRIPGNLSFEEAATLPCAALTAWNAVVETGQIKAGETIAMLGTGGVSCFALAFAKMHGAYTFLTSSSEEKLTRAKTLGADALINYRSQPDWDQEILKQTGGTGVDLVIEVGGAGTLERSMNAVRPGGTICVIGALAGAGAINPRMINRKAIRLQGIHVGSRDMFAAMNKAVALHRLNRQSTKFSVLLMPRPPTCISRAASILARLSFRSRRRPCSRAQASRRMIQSEMAGI